MTQPPPAGRRGPRGTRVGDVVTAENSRWLVVDLAPERRQAVCRLLGGSRVLHRFLEHERLDVAERQAGGSGFADHAERRLEAGERAYGHRWTEVGLPTLLAELLEEAADLGAWGVLALQALEAEPTLGAAERDLVEVALNAALMWGAFAHKALVIVSGHCPESIVQRGTPGRRDDERPA